MKIWSHENEKLVGRDSNGRLFSSWRHRKPLKTVKISKERQFFEKRDLKIFSILQIWSDKRGGGVINIINPPLDNVWDKHMNVSLVTSDQSEDSISTKSSHVMSRDRRRRSQSRNRGRESARTNRSVSSWISLLSHRYPNNTCTLLLSFRHCQNFSV